MYHDEKQYKKYIKKTEVILKCQELTWCTCQDLTAAADNIFIYLFYFIFYFLLLLLFFLYFSEKIRLVISHELSA